MSARAERKPHWRVSSTKIKKRRICASCGERVKGSFEGIDVSICCAECCEETITEQGEYCVSKRTAMEDFRCKQADLNRLSFKFKRNPFDARFCSMRFYLVAEVQHLGRLRISAEKKKRAERLEKRRLKLMKRKESALKILDPDGVKFVDESDKTLMVFLIGDYVRQSHPRVFLKDIRARSKVLSHVREILQECPGAHPGAAIDFCMAHPDAGAIEFLELKNKMQKVFYVEGKRILHHLSSCELDELQKTALKEDCRNFMSEDT